MSEQPIDWPARAVMARLIFTTAKNNPRSGFKDLAAWWIDRLHRRTPSHWRDLFRRATDKKLAVTNVGLAMATMGIEPTVSNYIELVNAARKEINPRVRRIVI